MATAQQRSTAARIAALSLHAQVDSRRHTEPARAAWRAKFTAAVVAAAAARGEVLSDAEVERRARLLLRAHMQRIAAASAKTRRTRKITKTSERRVTETAPETP